VIRSTHIAALVLLLASTNALGAVELTQPDGSVLTLPGPAESIITLSPHLTELAFAAGAGSRVIATVEYSEFPSAARSIPRIGDAFRLDMEKILTLRPDLVVAWQSGNPATAIDRLQSLGIATWLVEIRRPEEIALALEEFGQASGNNAAGRQAADQVRAHLRQIEARYSGLDPVSYFYQVAVNPLYTINGDHLISRSLELCQGLNIFGEARGLAPMVSRESVILANPQALLAPMLPGQQDPLLGWHDWPGMRAVAGEALFLLPADEISRATPRMLDAVAMACDMLNQLRTGDSP